MADKVRAVYVIEHCASSRVYVGTAVDVLKRWREHQRWLRLGQHCNGHLQRAWNKYGAGAFEWHVLLEMPDASPDEMVAMEARVIAIMGDVFNITVPGLAPMQGRQHSSETRAKISKAMHGKSKTPEHRSKVRAANGKPETRAKIGDAHRGKTLTPETRAKISATKQARHGQ